MAASVVVPQVTADDWECYWSVRLDALHHDPDAFGSTLEHQRAMSRADWLERLAEDTGPSMMAKRDRRGSRSAVAGSTSLHG